MTLQEVAPKPEPVPKPEPRSGGFSRGKLLRWLKATQKYSAYGILVFAGLHLTSTVLLPPFSVTAADSAFMAARDIYQSALGEKVLVYGSFGVHVISGLLLRGIRISSQYSDFGKLSFGRASPITYSGFFLTLLAFLHFIAVRLGPSKALGDSSLISLDYITYSLSEKFSKVAPSLVLLVTVFTFHSLGGLSQYLGLKLRSITRYATLTTMFALALKSVTSLSAQPAPTGWIADQYHIAEVVSQQLMGKSVK